MRRDWVHGSAGVQPLRIHRPDGNLQLFAVIQPEVELLAAGRPLQNLQQIVILFLELEVGGVAFLTEAFAGLRTVIDVEVFDEQAVVLHFSKELPVAFVDVFGVAVDVVGRGLDGLLGLLEGVALGTRLLLAHRPFVFDHEAIGYSFVQAVFGCIFGAACKAVEVRGGLLEVALLLGAGESTVSFFEG